MKKDNDWHMLTIDLDYFVKRLTCWLAPEVLIQAARRIEDDRDQAMNLSAIAVTSSNLSVTRDGGIMFLVEAFLERFRIPGEVIGWLKQSGLNLPVNILDEFADYKFSGKIRRPTPEMNFPPEINPIAIIQERDVYADILTQPMQGLGGMVSSSAKTWLYFLDNGMDTKSFFLKHVSADPFGAWMDATTAQNLGFSDIANPKNSAIQLGGVNMGYRLVTLMGGERAKPDFVLACRTIAKIQADQTLEPLDEEGLF